MRAEREALQIPVRIRRAVDERDQLVCRMCGRYEGERRVQHHIWYGGDAVGMGGRRRHTAEGIITLGHDCHGRAHARKHLWQPLLAVCVGRTGVTAFQLLRWREVRRRRTA